MYDLFTNPLLFADDKKTSFIEDPVLYMQSEKLDLSYKEMSAGDK